MGLVGGRVDKLSFLSCVLLVNGRRRVGAYTQVGVPAGLINDVRTHLTSAAVRLCSLLLIHVRDGQRARENLAVSMSVVEMRTLPSRSSFAWLGSIGRSTPDPSDGDHPERPRADPLI